jgi:heat shock protein HtpX
MRVFFAGAARKRLSGSRELARSTLLLSALAALFGLIGFGLAGAVGATWALVSASAVNLYLYFRSGAAILKAQNAGEVAYTENPFLVGLVRSLAARADVPPPRVFLVESLHANACAVGRSPETSTVVLTTGLIASLNTDQLSAVIGHELAHIKRRDVLVMTIAATLSGAVAAIGALFMFIGFGTRRDGGGPLIALGIGVSLAAMILHMTASREAEFVADRFGAKLTGGPRHLIEALELLKDQDSQELPLLAAPIMFVCPPLIGKLLASYPPIEERIARLRTLT